MKLDVGCGPNSTADFQIDKTFFPNMEKYNYAVQDAMIHEWIVPSESMDEVRMEQFLEHCPVSVRLPDLRILYPRIHCMKEAYRVLKPGGILHVSVPGTFETHCQDPTHEGPQITEGWFNYFCGEWGGNKPGDFATESYGINFQFTKLTAVNDGFTLTVRLYKEDK